MYTLIHNNNFNNDSDKSKHIEIFDINNSQLKSTRNNLLRLPSRKCESFTRSIKYRLFNVWNKLKPSLRNPDLKLKQFTDDLIESILKERT